MKRFILTTIAVLSVAVACQQSLDLVEDSVVEIPEGAVMLQDAQFGMYYGNVKTDTVGVFSIVLSDARCYQEKLGKPYLDSEGDMLVLEFRTELLEEGRPIALPYGSYVISDEGGAKTVYTPASYVLRMTGSTQSRWSLKSGVVKVSKGKEGKCLITALDMIIEKDGVEEKMDYVCLSNLKIDDYLTMAPSMITTSDDIVDMPFPRLDCVYNGDLYGSGTGSFVVNLSTKGFYVKNENGEDELTDIPGVYITLSFFSRLYSGTATPILEAGRYTVSTATSESLFQRWSILPGLMMETTPFGSYVLQQPAEGEGTMEFINSGYVDVAYEEEPQTKAAVATKKMIMTYSFTTSSRKIYGVWKGDVTVDDQAGGSNESFLTTLDHDVECNMSKVTEGYLRLVETLHRKNVKPEWDYDIAEAWQLYLQPRDWTAEEKDIPWVDPENPLGPDGKAGTEDDYMYDKNNNGIRDRLEAYCADGDVMILEFVLPLGSEGVIAPELNKTYTYTLQPSLSMEAEDYEVYVSRMGRPYDEIFDKTYANQNPGWAHFLEGYDRCNARRGFTWSEDGWRGNWYMHNEIGKHFHLDEYAPAINGWVKVTRTAESTYDFEWDFIDDLPGTPNKITGSIKGVKVKTEN